MSLLTIFSSIYGHGWLQKNTSKRPNSKLQTGTPQNTGWLCPSSFYSLWQTKTGRGKLTKNTEILWGDWGLVPQSTHLDKQLVENVIFVSKCRLVLAAEVWLKPGITWKHGEFYTEPVGIGKKKQFQGKMYLTLLTFVRLCVWHAFRQHLLKVKCK